MTDIKIISKIQILIQDEGRKCDSMQCDKKRLVKTKDNTKILTRPEIKKNKIKKRMVSEYRRKYFYSRERNR